MHRCCIGCFSGTRFRSEIGLKRLLRRDSSLRSSQSNSISSPKQKKTKKRNSWRKRGELFAFWKRNVIKFISLCSLSNSLSFSHSQARTLSHGHLDSFFLPHTLTLTLARAHALILSLTHTLTLKRQAEIRVEEKESGENFKLKNFRVENEVFPFAGGSSEDVLVVRSFVRSCDGVDFFKRAYPGLFFFIFVFSTLYT